MAIARDALSSGGGSTNTVSVSHTITGTDTVLVSFVRLTIADELSGVTFNGVSMTQVDKKFEGNNEAILYCYILINPSTGTHNIVGTQSGTRTMAILSQSYTDIGQVSQPDAFADAAGTTLGVNDATVNVVAANSWFVGGFASNDTIAGYSPDNGGVEQISFGPTRTLDSNGVCGTGNQAVGYTSTGSGAYSWCCIGVSLSPVASGPTSVKTINGLVIASVKNFNSLATGSIKSINGVT